MKFVSKILTVLVILIIAPALYAREITTPNDIEKLNSNFRMQVLGDDLAGDRIDISSGTLSLRHVDVSLPGNFDIPVEFARTWQMNGVDYSGNALGGWIPDIPFITMRTSQARDWPGLYRFRNHRQDNSNICFADYWPYIGTTTANQGAHPSWAGLKMSIPGQGLKTLARVSNNTASHPHAALKDNAGVTSDDWQVFCEGSIIGAPGRGIVAVDPKGTKYYFSQYSRKYAGFESVGISGKPVGATSGPRTRNGGGASETGLRIDFTFHNNLYVTKVEDVHENTVHYTYDDYGNLESISSSDGRLIEVEYYPQTVLNPSEGSQEPLSYDHEQFYREIHKVKSGNRVWVYEYAGINDDNYHNGVQNNLRKVVQPDGRHWLINLPLQNNRATRYYNSYECHTPVSGLATYSSVKRPTADNFVVHPMGARTDFKFRIIRNTGKFPLTGGVSKVPSQDHVFSSAVRTAYDGGNGCNDYQIDFTPIRAVTEKRITHPTLPSAVWTYDYQEGNYCPDEKFRTITHPDGRRERIVVACERISSPLNGRTVEKKTFSSSGELMQTQLSEFELRELKRSFGFHYDLDGNRFFTGEAYLTKTVIDQDGDTFTTEYNYNTDDSLANYSYGQPVKVTTYSTVSTNPKVTETQYFHNTSKWILGLPSLVQTNGREIASYAYDSNGDVESESRFGHPYQTHTYYYNGTRHTTSNALLETYTAENYKAGVPQKIIRPDNTAFEKTIDDNGWLTAQTNSRKHKFEYEYDIMGRVTKVDLPANANGADWADTIIAYDFTGPIKQTITKANAVSEIKYDSMLRPVLEETRDTLTGDSIFVRKEYDGLGRNIFTSVPSFSDTEADGTVTTYDALGRVTSTAENYGDYVTVTHEYKSGNEHWVTDGEGNTTITARDGYSGPGRGDTISITQPEGINTEIARNIWGEMTSLTQHGDGPAGYVNLTQQFYYDDQRRLCRHVTPEGGHNLYNYDAVGRLIASRKGDRFGGTYCRTPYGGGKVTYDYDAMGRLIWQQYYDTIIDHNGENLEPITPNMSRTYDADGNVLSVKRHGAHLIPDVSRYYAYNELDMITSESMVVIEDTGFPHDPDAADDPDLIEAQYDISYDYDPAGNVISKTLPSGRALNFTPDGLGRTTGLTALIDGSVQTLASNIDYFAGGAMKTMTYGNGLDFTQTLNARLLPDSVRVDGMVGGTFSILQDLSYTYDKRAKVKTITNGVDTTESRSFDYDDVGRLTDATGPWGTASYSYDAVGNLHSKSFMENGAPSRTVTNRYDTVKNRVTTTEDDGPNGDRALHYDSHGNVYKLGRMRMLYDRTDQPAAIYGRAANGERTVGDYIYDGNLKRAKSIMNGEVIYNVYDAAGSLVHVDIRPRPDGNGGTIPGSKTDYIPGFARIKTDYAGTSTVTYMHDDHLKSASLATKGDGTIAWAESYTPFGETLLNPAANDNQGGFTGHIKDKATGLNYMQARYYDPNMGRFLSIDPVTFLDKPYPGQFNRYAYTWNDPINANDPDGEFLNFVAKFVVDVGLEVAIQAASGQKINVGSALKSSAKGVLDPTKTVRKAAKLAKLTKKVACFEAGTLVLTKDGKRAIETITAGDVVWSSNPETGQSGWKTVANTFINDESSVWELTFADNAKQATVLHRVTGEHPYWVLADGVWSWKAVADLKSGMIVETKGGKQLTVIDSYDTKVVKRTYNFEVEDFHTYYVGDEEILVHNDCKLKSLTSKTKVGDRVKTPANSKGDFTKLKGGQGFKDNKTGTIMQKSKTNHSNSPGGEFKAGTKPGKPPTKSEKVTISGGKQGGCVIKKDGC